MLNNILFYSALLIFLYSAIYIIYFLLIVIVSGIKKHKLLKLKEPPKYNNIIIVVYSHNNEKTVTNLLEQLNKQNYPKGNYQTHIILDNCYDNSSNKLEFIGSAKLWRLNDDRPLGKDKAVSWLLENLMSFKQVDAYVFLNANRMVKPDFLSNINDALIDNDVVVGSTEIIVDKNDLFYKMYAAVNEYNTYILNRGRSLLKLAVPIDSDITIIKHRVLEQIKCIDFKNINSELKYSFLLTKVGFAPKFAPLVKTFVSSSDYKFVRPDFTFKLSLFFHCFNLKTFSDFKFLEFLFALLAPNPIMLVLLLVLIHFYSVNHLVFDSYPFALGLIGLLVVSFSASIYHFNYKQILYLIPYPLITLTSALSEIFLFKKFFKLFKKKEKLKTEKITVPVSVTNGKNVFPCTLELISEGGFKKAVFKYKNKKQRTQQSFVRMCDAIKNISDIISQHGFKLNICQCCAYFSPKIDGTNNMVKGFCSKKGAGNNEQAAETVLWYSCKYFLPQEVNNVIDISKFVKKE